MTTDRFQRFLPVAGILAGMALIAGLALSGSEPSESASARELATHYSDNHDAIMISSIVVSQLFCVLLLFFTVGLRAALRSGEAGESTYSTAVAIGGTVTAVGISVMNAVAYAAAEAADRGSQATVVEGLHLLGSEMWMPWAVGAATLLIAAGLGGLRTLALPRWLAWATLVLGVIALTPAGVLTFILMPLWLIATGIVLSRRQRAATAPRPATATA